MILTLDTPILNQRTEYPKKPSVKEFELFDYEHEQKEYLYNKILETRPKLENFEIQLEDYISTKKNVSEAEERFLKDLLLQLSMLKGMVALPREGVNYQFIKLENLQKLYAYLNIFLGQLEIKLNLHFFPGFTGGLGIQEQAKNLNMALGVDPVNWMGDLANILINKVDPNKVGKDFLSTLRVLLEYPGQFNAAISPETLKEYTPENTDFWNKNPDRTEPKLVCFYSTGAVILQKILEKALWPKDEVINVILIGANAVLPPELLQQYPNLRIVNVRFENDAILQKSQNFHSNYTHRFAATTLYNLFNPDKVIQGRDVDTDKMHISGNSLLAGLGHLPENGQVANLEVCHGGHVASVSESMDFYNIMAGVVAYLTQLKDDEKISSEELNKFLKEVILLEDWEEGKVVDMATKEARAAKKLEELRGKAAKYRQAAHI